VVDSICCCAHMKMAKEVEKWKKMEKMEKSKQKKVVLSFIALAVTVNRTHQAILLSAPPHNKLTL
jgi:hypothetical protein